MQTYLLNPYVSCCAIWVSANEFAVITTFSPEKMLRKLSIFSLLGSKAKAYQVKQVRGVIVKYTLGGESNEQ
jgi:NADH/NAD ratio-sensing transcriptional regulator Rex